MAEAYLSQTGFTYFWGKLEGILDNKDAAPGHLVFNRSVALKDSFKK